MKIIPEETCHEKTWLYLESVRIKEWYIMSSQSRHSKGWRAWAKKEPLKGNCPLSEKGDVWSETGNSRQHAIDNLFKKDLDKVED